MIVPYFILWKWKQSNYRSTFDASHVNAVAWMMRKHGVPLDKIVCITDDPTGVQCRTFPLWNDHRDLKNISGSQLPSCYRRLKLFDPDVTDAIGIPRGHRVVSFDLDAVILQDFLALFQGHHDREFVGWRVPGMRHRVVFNGSMWMFGAGTLPWVWETFDPSKSPTAAIQAGYMGSDQGYLSHQLISMQKTGGWTAAEHGVLSYMRDIIKLRVLPKHTRVVFFPGKNKPWLPLVQKQSSWITRYWPKPEQLVELKSTEEVAA